MHFFYPLILHSRRSRHRFWVVTFLLMTSTSWRVQATRRPPFTKLSIRNLLTKRILKRTIRQEGRSCKRRLSAIIFLFSVIQILFERRRRKFQPFVIHTYIYIRIYTETFCVDFELMLSERAPVRWVVYPTGILYPLYVCVFVAVQTIVSMISIARYCPSPERRTRPLEYDEMFAESKCWESAIHVLSPP